MWLGLKYLHRLFCALRWSAGRQQAHLVKRLGFDQMTLNRELVRRFIDAA